MARSSRIRFNKGIYRLKAVKEAIEAYKPVFQAEVEEDKKYYSVILEDAGDEETERIKDEFANYVLALTRGSL